MKAAVLCVLLIISCVVCHAADLGELTGVVPGKPIGNLRKAYPANGFPSFRAPVLDKALQAVFYDVGVAVLPPNVAVSLSAERAFASANECARTLGAVKARLDPFFPKPKTDIWAAMSQDGSMGLSLGCTMTEEAPYMVLRLAITHLDSAQKFRQVLDGQRGR